MMKLGNHPGWYGAFTREQAEGAIPNGTRIVKAKCDEGDANPIGTPGKVLGSIANTGVVEDYEHVKFLYFIEWENNRLVAVGLVDYKIARADQ